METVNKVILKGGISGVRKISIVDSKVARFVLMTRYFKTSKEGHRIVETELHNVVVWKNNELFEELMDGKIVEVEGRVRYVRYISAEGEEKILTEIVANKLVSVNNQE